MFDRYSERARQVIFISRWFAEKRKGLYVEPEDLLRALIREDRGESLSLLTEVFPDVPVPSEQPTIGHRPFFDDNAATDLLRELQDEAPGLSTEARDTKRQTAPLVDMPISHSLARPGIGRQRPSE